MQHADWTAVSKQRWLIFFEPKTGASPGEPPTIERAAQRPPTGCQAEWTEVSCAGQSWLTLGFESFGEPASLEPLLLATVRHVLAALPTDLPLSLGRSQSYPGWLANKPRANQGPPTTASHDVS